MALRTSWTDRRYTRSVDPETLSRRVSALDTADERAREEAWDALRDLGDAVLPALLAAYGTFRTWQGRTALVFHAIRYARTSAVACELGLRACGDRSRLVRHRACGLLAYSLRSDALSQLEPLTRHRDARTVADARAAIDAIRSRNHHYFVDRDHSGRSFWHVNDGDTDLPGRRSHDDVRGGGG